MEPICLCLNMYIALIYGLLYIWFESFPIVFVEIYGFSLGLEGLSFLGILIGTFVVFPPFVWYQHKYIEPKFDENGELTPEWRLPPSFVGAFAIPICLFWFGWSARPSIHWIMPIIGSAWFSVGAFLLFNSVLNYLSDAYPADAASVLAGNDFFRSCFGAGFVSSPVACFENSADRHLAIVRQCYVQLSRCRMGLIDTGFPLYCIHSNSLRPVQVRKADPKKVQEGKTGSII